jgi:hypothetical protein
VNIKRIGQLLLAMVVSTAAIWSLVTSLGAAGANGTAVAREAALERNDPVVVAGASLNGHLGTPLAELVLYAYQGGLWQPIPFQIDEVVITGSTYVSYEDGLLDANDEVVFMGTDTGESVTPGNWPEDDEARLHLRSVITVTDSLAGNSQGWVYLYRSTTLTRTAESYVAWNEPLQTLTAVSYTASFSPNEHLGFANLMVNGVAADILDRQKLRAAVTIYFGPIPVSSDVYDEEEVGDLLGVPLTVSLPVVGPVRAVGGSESQKFAFYPSRLDLSVAVPVTDIITGALLIHFDSIRVSNDLNDPAATGMAPATYYNSGLAGGVPIDGVPDAVPSAAPDWYETAGAIGGLVTVLDVDPGNGILSNYYKDDSTVDPEDTGDGRSYGDAGLQIAEPNDTTSIGLVTIDQSSYILPGGSGNVGDSYQARVETPLAVATAEEMFDGGPGPVLRYIYLPAAVWD